MAVQLSYCKLILQVIYSMKLLLIVKLSFSETITIDELTQRTYS